MFRSRSRLRGGAASTGADIAGSLASTDDG
jgi:hypothetical protein